MLRELTSVFIAAYLVLVLVLLHKISVGRVAYEAYVEFLANPGMITFHVIALVAALYHTYTWFSLVPNIVTVRVSRTRVPKSIVSGAHFLGWIVTSIAIARIVLLLKVEIVTWEWATYLVADALEARFHIIASYFTGLSNELLYVGAVVAVAGLVVGGGTALALTFYVLSKQVEMERSLAVTRAARMVAPAHKTSEPFWWLLFGAGGMVAALLVPIQIVLTGISAPSGWLGGSFEYSRLLALVSRPLSRIYLLTLISFPLFHWAHRFRFTLLELGLKRGRRAVATACYSSAILGTIITAVVLIGL
jgi:fumarate reductase subunit D